MSRIAILSDIHANSDALTVVLDKCAALGITDYISLGDIVGYNAEPEKCLDMVRDLNFRAMVIGNHDYYAIAGDPEMSGFNPVAREAISWTRAHINEENAEFLRRRESCIVPGTGITAVHATLDTPHSWGYIFDRGHAGASFSYQLTQLCFCGHTHHPVAFDRSAVPGGDSSIVELSDWLHNKFHPENDTNFDIADELTISYVRGHKYLINVGSIGQPRNGDPRASFAVVDTDRCQVTRYRLPYDIASAQEKILAAGLPEGLASRLASGR